MPGRSLTLCCSATLLLSVAHALVLPAGTRPLSGPKLRRVGCSPLCLAAAAKRGGGGGGGGFGAKPVAGSKPKGVTTGSKAGGADLRAAAKAYDRLNADSALETDVYVRASANDVSLSPPSPWLSLPSPAWGAQGPQAIASLSCALTQWGPPSLTPTRSG